MLTLEITSGPGTGQSLELDSEIVIGREDAGLVIDDPEISRRHARIAPIDGGVVVEDLGSTNGTFVNGERASGPVTLRESGTIHVGTTDVAITIPQVAETRVRKLSDFDPDVTRARPIASDLTAPRKVAPLPVDPDLTAARPIAGPPPPGPPPPGPPPPGPAVPAPAAARQGPPVVAIAIVALVLVAIVVVVVLFVL
jgi:hypothetical protein